MLTQHHREYCTLFDFNYLSRGLALYLSLREKSSRPFKLTVLAMDDACYQALTLLNLESLKVIHLEKEFLTPELKQARENRTWAEFCWTCSSSLLRTLFETHQVPEATYLDADIYFFADPELIFKEFNSEKAALITEHYYFKNHDQSLQSGRFCVQFMPFKNNPAGNQVLLHWNAQCLEDCSLSPEKGICGDQKYLDEWPSKYPQVVISSERGAGVAPWNLERFTVDAEKGNVYVSENQKRWPVIFFHFHGLKFFEAHYGQLSGERYQVSESAYENIYRPYFKALAKAQQMLARVGEKANHGIKVGVVPPLNFKSKLKAWITGNANFVRKVDSIFTVSCPVCDHEVGELKFDHLYDDRYGYPGFFDLNHCSRCDHLFLRNDFKSEDFTKLYTEYYPRAAVSVKDFVPVKLHEGIRGWWQGEKSSAFTWVPEKTSVLDIGSGLGYSIEFHQRRGSRAVGIDADQNVQKIAEAFSLDVKIGLFDANLFKGEKFEYVTLDQVLEHSTAPIQMLKEVKTVLKENGRIILSIPNAHGFNAHLFGKKWIHWHTPYHLQFFSKSSLATTLRAVGGLEIESRVTITHSHWIFYQMLALITYPKAGTRSAFWSDLPFSFFQKVMRKGFGLILKLGVFSFYTRVLDGFGLGDNQIIVIRRIKN